MTSDAKIGLLLGLVFIFVIAFVINGLPGLHHKDDSNKLTTSMVGLQSNQSGLGANERKVALEPAPVPPPAADYPQQPAQNALGSADPRFTMALPDGTSSPAPVVGTADIQPTAAGVTEQATAPPPPAEIPLVPPSASPTPTVAQNKPPAKPESTKPAAPKSYAVEDGDTLSSIAKKLYGEQEGNKVATINALFEANRKTLGSPDELYVGQKLIIPPLPAAAAPAPTTSPALSGPGFAKADSIGKRHLPTGPDKPTPTVKSDSSAKAGNVYVVKDGDSLWRIAAERLGDGNRYKEIVKLNAGVLASEDDLEIGMQLKLPAR